MRAGRGVYDVEAVSRILFQYRRYRLPLRAPVRTAHGVWTEREGLLVRLETEAGSIGYGEAAVLPWFGTETADEAEEACRTLAGKSGAYVETAHFAEVPARLECLRNALAAAAPGPSAIVAPAKSYLPVAALLPAGRAALEVAPARAEIGFRTFKWKVGVGDLADELALLDDVCGALPSGAKLRLDANGAWDRRKAERWLERCAERPVEFVEQPVAPQTKGAEDLLLGLAEDWPTPLALDESLVGGASVEWWLRAGWPGVFVVKPSLMGDGQRILAQLKAAKAAVVFSSALETAMGARTALRAAFHWDGEARALGFGVWPLFADARFDGPALAPFIRWEDVQRLDPEAVWTALS